MEAIHILDNSLKKDSLFEEAKENKELSATGSFTRSSFKLSQTQGHYNGRIEYYRYGPNKINVASKAIFNPDKLEASKKPQKELKEFI